MSISESKGEEASKEVPARGGHPQGPGGSRRPPSNRLADLAEVHGLRLGREGACVGL